MKDYIEYWDEVISLWSQGQGDIKSIPENEKCWFVEGTNLHSNLMPEPYWGDPGRCSAVLLNYNPGGPKGIPPIEDNCHINHVKDPVDISKMSGAMFKKYSDVAKRFPWKDKNSEYAFVTSEKQKASKNWMLRRNKWICSLVGETNLPPFFMEICGWHSYNWKGVRFKSNSRYDAKPLMDYLKKHILPVLMYAIPKSQLGIGLCVGKQFADVILPVLGFKAIMEPVKPITDKHRYFQAFEQDGVKILCTWSWASNNHPSDEYLAYEKELISKLTTK